MPKDTVVLEEHWTFHGGATCTRFVNGEKLDSQTYDEAPIIYITRRNDLTKHEADRLIASARKPKP